VGLFEFVFPGQVTPPEKDITGQSH
jgi:hypothetical protein